MYGSNEENDFGNVRIPVDTNGVCTDVGENAVVQRAGEMGDQR